MPMASRNRLPRLVTAVPRLPPRRPETHKGDAGRVVIIAGSRGMSGAACLAGLGALRGGAGLVRVLVPDSILPIVANIDPCLMTVPLAENEAGQVAPAAMKRLQEMAFEWATAIAIGPGLGATTNKGAGVRQVVQATLTQTQVPVVADADALNAAPDRLHVWLAQRDAPQTVVVTPHPGEMARLRKGAGLPELAGADDDTRVPIAHEYARLARATVVLKGHRTIVATPDEAYINTTGNPGMATGGMGDVLTGLIAALLGQGLSAFDAARLGVYAHGQAADRLAKQIAPIGYLAREVADALPGVLAEACRPPMGFK
jgi:NAD(P)H-hydrate epimerase